MNTHHADQTNIGEDSIGMQYKQTYKIDDFQCSNHENKPTFSVFIGFLCRCSMYQYQESTRRKRQNQLPRTDEAPCAHHATTQKKRWWQNQYYEI